jgi:hypothetical protein
MEKLIYFLEDHMGSCYYKRFLGFDCPGCGIQRSFIYLLKGEFIASLQTYPALIPTIAMLVFLVLHLVFKWEHGAKVLLYIFFFNLAIMLVSYAFKMAGFMN